jgi:carboxylesterase
VRSAEFVLENIGSDDVDFVLLHDSYHMVTLDNEKDLVASETIRFFRDRARTRAAASPGDVVVEASVRKSANA